MTKNLHLLFALICMYSYSLALAQKDIFTAGFQYRPLFPSEFFNTGTHTLSQHQIDFSISQKTGYNAGMIIRRGYTRQFSIETGISYTKRNFTLSLRDSAFTRRSGFTIIGYEIPFLGMIFLRMADNIYMNTSMGVSMDMYPSNIATHDTYFLHFSQRRSVFQFAALANLGAEYRSKQSGYFYLGASYHLPFSYFYTSSINYLPKQEIARIKLYGNFIALDFRYYFHEEPIKPKKKAPKN